MTMTLERLRDELDGSALGTQERHVRIVDSIDAAIRERDRLRGDVAGMTEELLHVPSRDDWRELQQRAERAEAEAAALQARLDALMLEFCPDDMTGEQRAAWAARQKPVEG